MDSSLVVLFIACLYWTCSSARPLDLDESWPGPFFQLRSRIYFPDNLPTKSASVHKRPWIDPSYLETWQPIIFPMAGSDQKPHKQGGKPIKFDDETKNVARLPYRVPYTWLEQWLLKNINDIEQLQDASKDDIFPKDYKSLIPRDVTEDESLNEI